MTLTFAAIVLILAAFVAANLPWISNRFLFVINMGENGKTPWHCLFEWLLLYFLIGALALLLEKKAMGQLYPQGWEFYVVTLCLFIVFALPGFVYRYDLKGHLDKARRRRQIS